MYREAITKFNSPDLAAAGALASAYNRLTEFAAHEKAHIDFLSAALGFATMAACSYSFPLSSVAEFLANASVLEEVGVSA